MRIDTGINPAIQKEITGQGNLLQISKLPNEKAEAIIMLLRENEYEQ